jgi:hypothetical protein
MIRLTIVLALLLAACDGDFFSAPPPTSFVLPDAPRHEVPDFEFLRDEIAFGQGYESEYQFFADGRFVFLANQYAGSSSCPHCIGYGRFVRNDSSITLSFDYLYHRPEVSLADSTTGTWKADTLRLTYPADLRTLDPLFRDDPYLRLRR